MKGKNNASLIVLGIFALVIVTVGASYAFFTYSRTGESKTTIVTGDIEFSYFEGKDDITIINQYPLSDNIGSVDLSNVYEFEVGMKSSITYPVKYNVSLISNNGETGVFKNDQIKFSLEQNGNYVAGTSETLGRKLSSIDGFDATSSSGQGYVLEDESIYAGQKHNYKLRIWISDDVNYSNTNDGQDEQTSTGKYNANTYSLRVKVNGSVDDSEIYFDSVDVSSTGDVTVDITSMKSLVSYSLTTSSSIPASGAWTNFANETSMNESGIVRVDTFGGFAKRLTLTVPGNGKYYLFVKNNLDQISKKVIYVTNMSE